MAKRMKEAKEETPGTDFQETKAVLDVSVCFKVQSNLVFNSDTE